MMKPRKEENSSFHYKVSSLHAKLSNISLKGYIKKQMINANESPRPQVLSLQRREYRNENGLSGSEH